MWIVLTKGTPKFYLFNKSNSRSCFVIYSCFIPVEYFVVGLFEFLGFMGSWLQVFSEVFGDYFFNPNLDFKKKHTFFGSTSFSGGVGKKV
jgi:hypothetical protein